MSSNPRSLSPTVVLLLGWIWPGAGHWALGRRGKAVFLSVVLLATFLAGFAMAEFRNVSAERHPYYFLAQAFCGLPTLVAWSVTESMPPLDRPIPGEDMGTLYICIASLLNALLFLDAFERAERKARGLAPRGAKDEEEEAAKVAGGEKT